MAERCSFVAASSQYAETGSTWVRSNNYRITYKTVVKNLGTNFLFCEHNSRGWQFRSSGANFRGYFAGTSLANFTLATAVSLNDEVEFQITVAPNGASFDVSLSVAINGGTLTAATNSPITVSSIGSDSTFRINIRGDGTTVFTDQEFISASLENLSDSTQNINLSAAASGGAGLEIPDTLPTPNNATLFGFDPPNDDSQWLDFSAGGNVQPLTIEQAQQVNDSALVNLNQLMGLALESTEQTNQSNTLDLTQVIAQSLTLETTQQTNETNTLSASQQQLLSSILSEQVNQSNWGAIHSAQAVILAAVEQQNESAPIDINQSDGQLIALIQVEQANQSSTLLVTQLGAIESIAGEQLNESSAINISESMSLTSITAEQINQTNLLNILTSGDNTDLSGLTLVPVTSVFTLIEAKSTYTLTEQ